MPKNTIYEVLEGGRVGRGHYRGVRGRSGRRAPGSGTRMAIYFT